MPEILPVNTIGNFNHIKEVMDTHAHIFYVVNERRQIVLSNIKFTKIADSKKLEEVLGLRIADNFGCSNSKHSPYGCGSVYQCNNCGALSAITTTFLSNTKVVSEAYISMEGNLYNQLLLEITATPFTHDKQQYVYVSAIDIEKKRRKGIMEKIFFHDVLNLMTSMQGYLEIMDSLDADGRDRFFPRLKDLYSQLLDEIHAQQELVNAENNQLATNLKLTDSVQLIEDVKRKMSSTKTAKDKPIIIDEGSDKITFLTDTALLSRVLINMLENALEASNKGEDVVMKSEKIPGGVRFSVHNNAIIPADIRFKIFKRSVTTKGKEHGLGTYRIRLLGEQYLKGQVGFTSEYKKGTEFFIEVPEN